MLPRVCGDGCMCSAVCTDGTSAVRLVWMPVKKFPLQQLALPKSLPALLPVHLSGICLVSRNCSINPPAICIPHRCCSLPLTSLLLELISLPPSCLRDASPLPQPISSGSASANERTAAESGNISNSTPVSPLPPQARQRGSDSRRSSIALPCVFQGQAPHPEELRALLHARVGNEVQRLEASETASAC